MLRMRLRSNSVVCVKFPVFIEPNPDAQWFEQQPALYFLYLIYYVSKFNLMQI